VFGVAGDSHNLAHQPAAIAPPTAQQHADALPERVLVREIKARQGLVDDRHRCGSPFIARRESATFDQRMPIVSK
jgi:hypothetical protein